MSENRFFLVSNYAPKVFLDKTTQCSQTKTLYYSKEALSELKKKPYQASNHILVQMFQRQLVFKKSH